MCKRGQGEFGIMAIASIIFTFVVLFVVFFLLIFNGGLAQEVTIGAKNLDLSKYTLLSILNYQAEENLNLADAISLSLKDNSYEQKINDKLKNLFSGSDVFYRINVNWDGGSYLFLREDLKPMDKSSSSDVIIPGLNNEEIKVELIISRGEPV